METQAIVGENEGDTLQGGEEGLALHELSPEGCTGLG